MKFRRITIAGVIAFGSLPAAQSAAQQGDVLTATQLRQMGGSVPALVSAPPDTGKEVLFAQGIQGQVQITGLVGIDGAIHDASIASSSRSSDLDNFALGLISNSRFEPAKDKMGTPTPVRVTIPVYLWKDSLADGSIFAKKCEDFVIDADWHAASFPDERPEQLHSWLLISGGAFAFGLSNGRGRPDPSFGEVYEACRKKPSRKFADVFMRM